jgi:ABC-2 type transport system permease protein
MTAFSVHFAFEFKAGLRNATAMLMNYLFPLGFYILMGLVFTQINPTFRDTMVPAMLIFAAMSSNLLGLPDPLVTAREAGIYRSFKINGVPAPSILATPTLSAMIHTLIVAGIIAFTAPLLFGAAAPTDWVMLALLALLTSFTFGAIGALIGVVSANSRATVLWSQLIFLPSMLLGGLMVPISSLPESVRPFAALLPATYAMQAFSGLAFDQPTVFDPVRSAIILGSSGVLAFGLAIFLFNWDSRNAARRGHPLLALLAAVPYVVGVFILMIGTQ